MNLPAPPLYESFAVPEDPKQGKALPRLVAGFEWLQWFSDIGRWFSTFASRVGSISAANQTASIGTTPVPIRSIPAGVYRLSYQFRVTRAGSVSSSLALTLSWTDGGIAQSVAGAAEAGNTTTTKQSGTVIARVDKNTAMSYATTYANGGGATAMAYSVDVVVESLALDTV